MDKDMEKRIQHALASIDTHEKVCALQYKHIVSILEERGTRLDRLEDKVDGLYKAVIGCAFAPVFVVVGLMQFI